jgi:peroxiredoxin
MTELGKLEAKQEEFARRNTRIVAVSLDNREDTAKTAEKFPHLIILSDGDRGLATAAEVLGPHPSPTGEETTAPTTILIDRRGQVRWVFREDSYLVRLSPRELLARVDEHLGGK